MLETNNSEDQGKSNQLDKDSGLLEAIKILAETKTADPFLAYLRSILSPAVIVERTPKDREVSCSPHPLGDYD